MGNSKAMCRLKKSILWSAALITFVTAGCNVWLVQANAKAIAPHVALVSPMQVALVLGTAPRLSSGPNRFFEARMDTAAALWHERKARQFLVSGDNGRANYDEVTAMRDALVRRGVPSAVITLDHAGFRTLDSMFRARQVFDVEKAIVVTDDWHLPRALFLARAAGIEATGACFESVPWETSARVRAREWFSRVKAVADIYVFRAKPKFLGAPIALHDTPS